ncbi:MAG: LamG-like jellyroll fold domain-containing protein [Myxococcaceae bacterium]
MISGTGRETEPLEATLGTWEGNVTSLELRWYRCSDAGCAPMGLTLQRYVPESSEVGDRLVVEVIATGPGGSTSAMSNEVEILAMPPAVVVLPEVQGVPREGQTLTASNGTWQWTVERFEYQWFACDTLGETCTPVAGATEDHWTPGFAEVGASVRVLVRAIGPGGAVESLSPPTTPVLHAAPRFVAPPVISGLARENELLSASAGQWAGAVDRFEYQWLSCDPSGTGCSPLQGQTAETLRLDGLWVGRAIRVDVTAIGPGGATTASSEVTVPVIEAPPVNQTPPAISGVARDGEVLTASPGTWTGRVADHRFAWFRCDPVGGACEAVGSDTESHLLVPADVGATIRVEVTAINAAGVATVSSASTRAVEALLPRNDQPPSIAGVVSPGQVLTGGRGAWSGTAPLSWRHQWLRCDALGAGCTPIPGAASSRYVIAAADVGHSLRLEVEATNLAGSLVATSPASGEVLTGYSHEVLADAPLGYWRFGEGAGATARDASGNGIDGTFFGGASQGVTGALPEGDRAASFNGVNGRVDFGDQFDLPGSSPFTFEAWIRPTVADAWHRRIVEKEEKNAAGFWEGYRLAISSSLGVYCQRWQSGNNGGSTSVPLSRFTLGNWYHVACTYDGTNIRMYVDGVLAATRASAMQVAVTSAPFTVGSFSGGGSSSWFAGDLDEVAVYGTALPEERLRAHVDAARPEAPLAFATPAIDGQAVNGRTLTGSAGTWRGALPVQFSWQWQRCDGAMNDCAAVPGATGPQYRVTTDDVGSRLQLRVTASNVAGAQAALSAPTAVVGKVPELFACVEAEEGRRSGVTAVYAGPAHTVGGTVVLGAQGSGALEIPVDVPETQPVSVWARVRAQTRAHDALRVAFSQEGLAASTIWEIPVSPVLRWQRVGEKVLNAGHQTLLLSGEDAGVEIDAVCFSSEDLEPEERLPEPPVRTVNRSVRDFGAEGDGVTDDTAALQAALSALKPGDALLIPQGRYRFTSTLTLNQHEVSIIGQGPGSVLFADFPASFVGNAINVAGGYEGAVFPLRADAFETGRELVVDATAPIAPGDALMVTSDEWGPQAPNLTTLFFRNRAHLVRVTAVRSEAAGKILTIDRPLQSEFTLAHNAGVQKFNGLREIVLANFRVEGTNHPVNTDNADSNLVLVNRCNGCFLADLEFRYARKAAVELGRALDTNVIRVRVSDATDTGGGGHGYGVAVTRSQGVIVRDSTFSGVLRHGLPISWGSRETFVFRNVFDRSTPHAEQYASVDIHGQDDYGNLVEDNLITGGEQAIIVGGGGTSHGNDGPWNVLRRNRIENAIDGIAVYKSSFHTVIDSNVLSRSTRYAVRIDSGSHDAHVTSNLIEGYGAAGVWVNASDRAEILDNEVAPGTGPALQLVQSAGYTARGNLLGGGGISEPGTGTVENNF